MAQPQTKQEKINYYKNILKNANPNGLKYKVALNNLKELRTITKKTMTRLESLNLLKMKYQAPKEDDLEISNPLTGLWIRNTPKNRQSIQNQIARHNDTIQEKIDDIEYEREVKKAGYYWLKMPVGGNPIKDDKVFLGKGVYYVSMDVVYSIFNKEGTIVKYDHQVPLAYRVSIAKKASRYKIADEVAWKYFNTTDSKGRKGNQKREQDVKVDENGAISIYASGFSEVWYKNLQIDKHKDTQGLENIPLRGKSLGYSLLGDTTIINENVEGLCVPEFIYYECQNQQYRTRLTKADIFEELEEVKRAVNVVAWENREKEHKKENMDAVQISLMKEQFFAAQHHNGYSTNMITAWAQQRKDVSVHAIDPLYKEFVKHIPDSNQKTRLSLCFIVNNDHLYPVVNPEIKKDIFGKHRIDMAKLKFKVNDFKGVAMKPEELELCDNITDKTKGQPLVFVEDNNLKNVVSRVIKETGMIDGAMTMSGNNEITGYKHPTTNTVFLSSPNYSDIQETCAKLNAHFKTVHFEFTNQSWAQLGKQLLNFGWLYPNESVYSSKYVDILEQYKVSPYNTKMYEEVQGDFETYDRARCYTKVVLENKEDYPIFYLNDPEPYSGEAIEAGEYYVNKMILLGKGTIKQRNGFYPSNLIKYCLANGYITKADITAKIRARFSLNASYFKDFVETIYKIFPYSHPACKNLMNHLLGTFGIVEKKYLSGCMTTSWDVAMAVKLKEENETTRISIYNHENMVYFIRKYEQHKETHGHKPIWRHIIAGSIIELDKMHKLLVNPNSQVLGYYTDSIKGTNFNKIDIQKQKCIGCILPESKKTVYGTYIHDITENEPFTLEAKQEWKVHREGEDANFDDIVKIASQQSCLVNGCAGAGKTEVIKRIVDEHTLTMAFTNKASRDVLKQRGVAAQTIDSFFLKSAEDVCIRRLKQKGITRIVIDEVSMLGLEKFKLLHKIKVRYPQMIFNLFGDFNQCPAVDDIVLDLLNENFIKNMCGGVQCVLKYKGTRYDMETYKQLEQFLESGYMPEVWKTKQIKQNLMTNICKTTQIRKNTRDKINDDCYKLFSVGRQKKTLHGKMDKQTIIKEFCVGMPIFAMMNNKENEIYNSQKYTLKSFTADGVMLEGKEAPIPNGIFAVVFGYGFCDSVYRFQGDCIQEEFNIFDTTMMSRNELYTALSRCKDINNVYFNYTDRKFAPVKCTTEIVKTLEENKRPLKTGFIYKIQFSGGRVYVGMTSRTLEERMQEHREYPVSKQMQKALAAEAGQINAIIKTTYTIDEQLEKLEKRQIKHYAHLGEKLLNVNHRKEEAQLSYTPFNTVDIKRDDEGKYQIRDNKNGIIRINHNGHTKLFRYGKQTSLDDAMKKAIEYRLHLLKAENMELDF